MTNTHLLKTFILLTVALSLNAVDYTSVSVNYKFNDKELTNTILIPRYSVEGKQPVIRGVMQDVGGPLKEMAYKNQIALIKQLDDGRGFSKELLVAAAKAAQRPELEHAGAIVQGISKGGREAAAWAYKNKERAIAVILDHSAIWSMDFPVRVKGVPMFFNSTYKDMFQGIDRRKSHHEWCTAAFQDGQACTSIIDIVKDGGHGGRGSTEQTALWLDEAIHLRVPFIIPDDKAYALIDVIPTTCGGYVTASLALDGARTFHDNVSASPNPAGANWWIPGPRTAALYLEWVALNGGRIVTDERAMIVNVPNFTDPQGDLKTILISLHKRDLSTAYAILHKENDIDPLASKYFSQTIEETVAKGLATLSQLEKSGDVYGLSENVDVMSTLYKGLPAFDEKLQYYTDLLKDKDVKKQIKIGKEFYALIMKYNQTEELTVKHLSFLQKFAEKYSDSNYGSAAEVAYKKLEASLSFKQSPERYFLSVSKPVK